VTGSRLGRGGGPAGRSPRSRRTCFSVSGFGRVRRVHVVVGEHPDGFHLGLVEQVCLVDDHDRGAAAFGVFGGEGVGGLGDEGGGVEAGACPSAETMWCSIPRTPTDGLGR
jgi:hypothetical protein